MHTTQRNSGEATHTNDVVALQDALAQGDAIQTLVTLSKLKGRNDDLLLAYASERLHEERRKATKFELEAASYLAELEARFFARDIISQTNASPLLSLDSEATTDAAGSGSLHKVEVLELLQQTVVEQHLAIGKLARALGSKSSRGSEALPDGADEVSAEAHRINRLVQQATALESGSCEHNARAAQASTRLAELEAKSSRCKGLVDGPGAYGHADPS